MVDFNRFFAIRNRMCKTYKCSQECPVNKFANEYYNDEIGSYSKCASCLTNPNMLTPELAEKLYIILDNWDKENPLNTRQNKFLELFPNAEFRVNSDGVLDICPASIDKDYSDKCFPDNGCCQAISDELCKVCKRNFWLKEIDKNDVKNPIRFVREINFGLKEISKNE